MAFAQSSTAPATPNMFSPASTPADSIYHLSLFVLAVCAGIFVTVFSLLLYSVVKYRRRAGDDGREPPQVYGSNQVELAWTVIPVLIVVVLFLATARVIHAVEDARFPSGHHRSHGRGASVLVGVPVSAAGVYRGQRAARSGQRPESSYAHLTSPCCRRTPITASGCRNWPARPI